MISPFVWLSDPKMWSCASDIKLCPWRVEETLTWAASCAVHTHTQLSPAFVTTHDTWYVFVTTHDVTVSCVHDMSHVTQVQCTISMVQDMYRWYGTHQPCFHNIHHVFTIWSSTVQDLKTWSCTTKLCQHDTYHSHMKQYDVDMIVTIGHVNHIMSTCSYIAYHVNEISYSWTRWHDM